MRKALIFAGLVLAGAAVLRGLRPSAPALSPRAFVTGIPALQADPRLVVARLDFIEYAEGESPKVAWGLDWGTTRASVSAPVRAHYALDLSGEAPVAFRFEDRRMIAVFRDPEVEAVEVRADARSALIEPGWARLSALSGQALVDSLERGLYAKAFADAGRAPLIKQVREAARPELTRLVTEYAARLGRKADVAVRFSSEEEPAVIQASR